MKILFAFTCLIITFLFGCKKTFDTSTILAVYTLGSGGNCTGATVSGRFVADTAVTDANSVTISVDVSVAGPYWITTDTINGISFRSIGTFTATGPQTAVLKAVGIPVVTDTADFTIKPMNGPGGSCTFSIATVHGVLPQYRLTCFFNGVYRNFSDSAVGTNRDIPGTSGLAGLDINGLDTVINSKAKIEFGVSNTGIVGQGTYTDTSFSKAYFNYLDSAGGTWSVNSTTQPSFTIAVTSVNTNIVRGTFSGIITNQQGMLTDTISVTNGSFTLPLK